MACVKLCKIATYISTSDSNNVVFVLIHTIISDLKVPTSTLLMWFPLVDSVVEKTVVLRDVFSLSS